MTASVRAATTAMFNDYSSNLPPNFGLRSALFQVPDFANMSGEELLDTSLSTKQRITELSFKGANYVVTLMGDWNAAQIKFLVDAILATRWILRRASVGMRMCSWRLLPVATMGTEIKEAFDEMRNATNEDDLGSAISDLCDAVPAGNPSWFAKHSIPIHVLAANALTASTSTAFNFNGMAPGIDGSCALDPPKEAWFDALNGSWGVVAAVNASAFAGLGGPVGPQFAPIGPSPTVTQTSETPPANEFGNVPGFPNPFSVSAGNLIAHELGHHFCLLHVFNFTTGEATGGDCTDFDNLFKSEKTCPSLNTAQAAIDNFMSPNTIGTSYKVSAEQSVVMQDHCSQSSLSSITAP